MAPVWNRLQGVALPLLLIGAIALIAAFLTDQSPDHRAFWSSYYFGYLFWMGVTLGCCTLIYLHHCIRAQWGLAILRILEAGARLVPWMALGMIPIGIAVLTGHIYDWANLANVAHWDRLHQEKAHFYLNPAAFVVRQCIYFVYWWWTTEHLRKSSLKQDETFDERLAAHRGSFAAPIGIIHVILVTFAYTDWLMSLTSFYSTLYGAWNITKNILSILSFGTILVLGNRYRRPYSDFVTPAITRDLGNVALGWTMFWGYTSLAQFLIIWSANLPDEIGFFTARFEGGLVYIGAFLIATMFFAPFLALITGRAKRTPEIMLRVAGWIFAWRIIDAWYDIVPFFRTGVVHGNLPLALNPLYLVFDIGAWVAFGGLWLALFVFYVKQHALYPAHDPRLIEAKEALAHGAH